MNIRELIKIVVEKEASDLHLSVGLPPVMRFNGRLEELGDTVCAEKDILGMLRDILPPERSKINPGVEIDLGIEVSGLARFRANIYHDIKGICVALRLIPNRIKALDELGLPKTVEQVCSLRRGLVLITGVSGSGKSTTLAAIIDKINSERNEHIITIEDPVEFVYENKQSIINQREVQAQTSSFAIALRAALRQDPNVILVGELRDLETIGMALTAAETGHLILTTLHSSNSADTVNRIIDVFPSHQQEQVRIQLAETLAMVVSQVLVPSTDGSRRYVACEVMVVNSAIRNMIRARQTHQLRSTISVSAKDGMQTLDQSLKALIDDGKITKETALPWVVEKNIF